MRQARPVTEEKTATKLSTTMHIDFLNSTLPCHFFSIPLISQEHAGTRTCNLYPHRLHTIRQIMHPHSSQNCLITQVSLVDALSSILERVVTVTFVSPSFKVQAAFSLRNEKRKGRLGKEILTVVYNSSPNSSRSDQSPHMTLPHRHSIAAGIFAGATLLLAAPLLQNRASCCPSPSCSPDR